MGLFSKTSDRNTSTAVLDRSSDRCDECGCRIPAGDVLCRMCE